MGAALEVPFFDRPPRQVAVDLIGCTLLHQGVGGRIVETEAYERDDPACHAYSGPTARNAPLFGPAARVYVYTCYGIHSMFNVVTDADGVAAAVLIRALEPTHGLDVMRERRGVRGIRELCSGPGKLCEALRIGTSATGTRAIDAPFAFQGRPQRESFEVVAGPRIGLTKAVDLPWRYCLRRSRYLSRPEG